MHRGLRPSRRPQLKGLVGKEQRGPWTERCFCEAPDVCEVNDRSALCGCERCMSAHCLNCAISPLPWFTITATYGYPPTLPPPALIDLYTCGLSYLQAKVTVYVILLPFYSAQTALQGKTHLCIPFLGIARPQSQFPHSCVCEGFICIFPGLVHIFPFSRIGRPILEIYKSLTDI